MNTNNATPIILVDGSSYLYRAYHSPPHLTNSKGENIGAVYGVINMLKSLIKQYQPQYIGIIFDGPGKTFRNDIYTEYKANRPPMPDDLRTQISMIHNIIKALGLPLIISSGVEADDVIGTLSKNLNTNEHPILISTGDKDMAQLVNDKVHLINTMTNTLLDYDGVIKKYGIPPHLIIDFLALMGDTSDNIPGLPGIGEKTAVNILQTINGIHEIYNDTNQLSTLPIRGAKKLPEKFLNNKDLALLSYQLATIKTDVALDIQLSDLAIQPQDTAQLITLYQDIELTKWLKELTVETTKATLQPQIKKQYHTITDNNTFIDLCNKILKSQYFCFDLETTSLDIIDSQIVGIAISIKTNQAFYIPLAHHDLHANKQLNIDSVLNKIKPILENHQIAKIGHNLKYDISVLKNYDIHVKNAVFDTMLQSYCLHSTITRHNMDAVAKHYLHVDTIHYEDIVGKGSKQKLFSEIDIETASQYACEDADISISLHEHLYPQLKKENDLFSIYHDIEVPLIPILSEIEYTGVLINPEILKKHSIYLSEEMSALEKDAHNIAGEQFNINSTKQLQEILFDKLQYPVLKKTSKGAPSTAEDSLSELALDYPLARIILDYRSLAKLKNTYTDKLVTMIHPKTKRLHTSYHQAITSTGRLSSTHPNLQNIPIKTKEGRKIREAFIAPTGYKIVAMDYSQIELRIMAHLSQDSKLIEAFHQGYDIHKATASEVWSVPLDKVTHEQRRNAKAVNFGLLYGMSSFGLAKQLNITRNEAQQYIDLYFTRYPKVLKYMETIKKTAREKQYVSTIWGRRLYLPEINAKNKMRQNAAERLAINAPMQGSAADLIKKAMILVHDYIQSLQNDDIKMIMQVHDELVFEIREDRLDTHCPKIIELMEKTKELTVPLVVEYNIGHNWNEAH